MSKINMDLFANDIRLTPIITENTKINQYNSEQSKILDIHAPLITREIIICPAAPWYTEEI